MINNDRYKLYNKNCLEVFKEIKDNSLDLIIIDPPYKTTKRGGYGKTGGMYKEKNFLNGNGGFEYNFIKPIEYIPELYRILKNNSHCYIMTNHINLQEILNTATNCGFHFIKSLIWNKQNKIMGQSYMSQFEYILFFRKGKHKKINYCGTSDILNIPNKKTKDKYGNNLHNVEKPIDLMQILVLNSSNENDVVLDCFMGIGGVGLACLKSNRKFIGIEIDKNYYDISNNRLIEYLK